MQFFPVLGPQRSVLLPFLLSPFNRKKANAFHSLIIASASVLLLSAQILIEVQVLQLKLERVDREILWFF